MAPYGLSPHTRDSLEPASLASSSQLNEDSTTEVSSRPSISSSRRLSLEVDDTLHSTDPAGRLGRSYSVSSAFDFSANLFSLSSTVGGGGYAPIGAPISTARPNGGLGGGSLEKHKTLTYLNGLSLIVGLIIGSGIFSSPGQVSSKIGSPGASLIVWVIAGILAWTGAASYAELGGAIPLNGGAQVYLAKTFGELSGFLFTWVAMLVLKPGSAAIVAIIMGEYLVWAFIGSDAETISPWITKVVALIGVAVVTFLNCVSTRVGTCVNNILMFMKFIALIGITATGVVVAITGKTWKGKASDEWKTYDWFANTSTDMSTWTLALYAGLWAYDGWDNTNYVVGEFRNPSRDLPRVIHTAMLLVILSYVLANVAYFLVLPLDSMDGSNTVAVMFGSQVFGSAGSLILAPVVSASCLGALNSSTFTSSRLAYTASKEGYIPSIFSTLGVGCDEDHVLPTQRQRGWFSKKLRCMFGDGDTGLFYTPVYALILNSVLTAGYCVVGEFSTLVTFYGVAGYTFYFITVLGLIVLRVREPELERPYKTWITTPIIFCCVSLFLLSRTIFAQPLQTITVITFVIAGIPVYFWRIYGRGDMITRQQSSSGKKWWQFWK
ncbi:amino acid permease-domain-containing protein [Dactylonectria estremocensis]|uniref:Amino acid permease-domain-containing protein n=1 Tax=Dactylonectria estremocensis TaxID=1079267 RepID=A0A9P9D7R7_9HYPO|nr:amino acid permease-domain-containing protein [Dactylonectria estremocensis]